MLVLLLIFVVIIAAYIYLVRPLNHWKKFNVKHTKPWPIFGDNLPGLLGCEGITEFTQRVYNVADNVRYTGYFEMQDPILCIKDPDLIKEIMIKDFDHFVDHKPFVDGDADPLWSNSLPALLGPKWREMRLTLTPAFTSSKMKHMFGLMTQVAENFTNYFLNLEKDSFEVELKETFSRFTNDVIATTAFGVEVDSIKNKENEFYLMGKEATNLGSFFVTVKILLFLILPKVAKLLNFRMFSEKVAKFFNGLIKDAIQVREEKSIVRPDLINILMNARKNAGGLNETKLTLEEITSQAFVFFFAGFESVSGSMCFACYEMAINQDIQNRLREEINKTLEETNGEITYEAIQNMKYLDMVVSETLRKWPSFANTDRVCTKPYTIKPVNPDEKPIDLKPNDQVVFPTFALQRDPKFFPNPDKFDPERFSDENKHTINPYAYIPFGGGPRNCIGSRFAILETKILLFYLLKHFKVVPNAKSEIPLVLHPRTVSVTTQNGFHFNFERLKN